MAMNLGTERLHEVTSSRPELIRETSSQHSVAASEYFYSFSDRSSPVSSDEATTVIRHQSPEDTRHLNPPRPQQLPAPHSQPEYSDAREHLDLDQPREFALTPRANRPIPNQTESTPASPTAPTVRHIGSLHEGERTPRPTTMISVTDNVISAPQIIPQPSGSEAREELIGSQRPTVTNAPLERDAPVSPVTAAVLADNGSVRRDDRYSLRVAESAPTPPPKNSQREWRNQIAQPVPTPGVDNTPELHFALDQLTRDEEIRGAGRYSVDSWGLQGGSRPDTRDSIHQPVGADPRASRGSDTRPLVPTIQGAQSHNAENRRSSFLPMRKPLPVRATPEAFVATPVSLNFNEQLAQGDDRIQPNNRASTQSWLSAASDTDANFRKDAKFNSVPDALRPQYLIVLIILCMFILAGLVVSSVHSALSYGMSTYDGTGTSLYFVYRYLPQLLAAFAVVWLHVVQAAIQRILPFVLIRTNSRKTRGEILRSTPLFIGNYLLPNLGPFQDGEVGLGCCNLVFWLTLFTVPLMSALYTPKYLSNYLGHGYWVWSTVQAICWTLIGLYFLLTIALIFVLFRINLRPTGLRWDPRCIADILVLLRRLNNTIRRRSSGAHSGRLDYRPASLGLWRSSSDPNALSHGIGVPRDVESGIECGSQPPAYQQFTRVSSNNPEALQHHSTFESWRSGRSTHNRWLPWFMRPSPVALWIAIALVLLIAFLVVSWVNRAVQVGFNPELFAGPNARLNFSSANFLWSFLPSLLGMFLYVFWLPFDAYFRALQPYVDMQNDSGANASQSVLLEYPAQIPGLVSVHALLSRHYRVAWIAFVPLIAITIPVLAGGVFQAQYVVGSDNVIHEIASLPGYIALCVFVIVYALSFIALWPNRNRRLPENIKYVASLGDFCLGGKMLDESTWRGPQTKHDLVGRLMSKGFTGEKGAGNELFHFGDYVDTDGRERIGIYRN